MDAFAVLDQIVAARCGARLTTVVDTLGLDQDRRRGYLSTARNAGPARRRRPRPHPGRRVPAAEPATGRSQCRRRTSTARSGGWPPVPGQIAAEGWTCVLHEAARRGRGAVHAPGAVSAAQRAAPIGHAAWLGAADLAVPLGRRSGRLARLGGRWRRRGPASSGIALMDHLIQIPQVGRDWEPIPEPWVTLGLLAGPTSGLRLGTLVTPGDLPRTRRPGQDRGHPGRAQRRPGVLRPGAGWWEREHEAFGLAFPAAGAAARPAGVGDRDAAGAVAAGHRGLRRRASRAAGDDLLPAAGFPRADHRGRQRRAPHAAHRRRARPTAATSRPTSPRSTEARRAARALRASWPRSGRGGDDRARHPVIGNDRDDAAAIVERHRGRLPAAPYAQRTTPARPLTMSAGTGCSPSAAWARYSCRCPTWPGRTRCSSWPRWPPRSLMLPSPDRAR